MTEATMPSSSDGSTGQAGGLRIDWVTTLAEHDRWLRTVVLARLGERQAVDEVMQEVALAAVAQRAPVNDPSRVGAWLYRLAVRLVLLYRRKSGRQRKLIGSYASRRGGEGEAVSDPLDWLLEDERRELVRQALGQLPRRDAEIILLKYTEDWSYKELAARLGISASAVEARLHRARQRLRQALAGTGTIEVSQ
jgi:RNA polymerase sigma-70 factor (ECF subfamily)